MKTRIFAFLMIGMIIDSFAQIPTLELTFTADNIGQHVSLDSILIENLTQGGDTTLYAPDTVLVLDYITGSVENSTFNEKTFSLSQNYPNPMEGKTKACIYLPEREDILVTISDIFGRDLINKQYQLERGSHTFTFYPGPESLYFLTVQADHQSRTVKMFNSPSYSFSSGILRLDYTGQQQIGVGENKSESMLNNFVFALGDELKFTASSTLGDLTVIDIPNGNQSYTFQYYVTGVPCPDMPTVTDIDGNVYNTVLIGDQCWMKENLKTTTYNNGTPIPNVTEVSAWSSLTSGAYVWYDNDISWKNSYGALYNWYTTVDDNELCPSGWHVPTNDEWTILTDYIGGIDSPHGNELKSCRQVNSPLVGGCNTSEHPRWNSSNSAWGTDDYGFSCLSGGYRNYNGAFVSFGTNTHMWSSTDYQTTHAWGRNLYSSSGGIGESYFHKRQGFTIRCLRD
ncbi:MAG: hypothetical protein CVT92_17170 [Bacteroidetes bacterium HGW-Bacteroidetes-1]|jgi:uncharacterized protein (TIGR02145 family)|nr:MAG: hypothetical protein CVT92_17170 [Bacteroidetes bacterium HGW-Bacteroidetes-1]